MLFEWVISNLAFSLKRCDETDKNDVVGEEKEEEEEEDEEAAETNFDPSILGKRKNGFLDA